MTAKISDLGVARILNLTPLQVSRMTQTPGTPAYMPPEVMVANPKSDTSVDEFSYGIMMIHIFSGQWPEPQVGPNRTEPGGRLIPVTEAERRAVFLRAVGNDHPLMDLIFKCINNHPQTRAHASEIVGQLAEMVLQFPASFANRLEMLRQIEAIKEKRALTEEGERKDSVVQQKESQILFLKEVQAKEEQKSTDIDRLKLAHSSEVEQLQLQLRDMKTQNQYTKAENEAEIVELKSKYSALETQIENKIKILLEEREQSARLLREKHKQHERQLRNEREQLEIQLAKEKAQNELLLQGTVSRLQSDITDKNTAIQMKEAIIRRKDSKLEAKSRALEEKDATISVMSEQITKIREYLATKQQVSTYLKVIIICQVHFSCN